MPTLKRKVVILKNRVALKQKAGDLETPAEVPAEVFFF